MASTALQLQNVQATGLPPEIRSVCHPSETAARHFDSRYALAQLQANGAVGQLPGAAASARASLAPIRPQTLRDRLTMLGMQKAANRPPAETTAWLNETMRLAAYLPEDILFEAIDELAKTLKFLPDVSEIIALAEPRAAERRRVAAQLEAMVRYMNSGQPIPKLLAPEPALKRPETPMTAEEAERLNAFCRQGNLLTRWRADGSTYQAERGTDTPRRYTGPPRNPTRDDYIALGVDPAVLDAPTIPTRSTHGEGQARGTRRC